MAASTAHERTDRSTLKLALPVIPAWLALLGVMRSTVDGQANAALILALAAALFVVALVMLFILARSLLPTEKHSLLPKQLGIVAATWVLAGILAAAPLWVGDGGSIEGVMQGFGLLTVAMAISYFAKGVDLIDDPDRPLSHPDR